MVDTIAPADRAERRPELAPETPAANPVTGAETVDAAYGFYGDGAARLTAERAGSADSASGLLLLTFAVLAAMTVATWFVDDWFYRPPALPAATVFVGVLTLFSVVAATRQYRPGTWSVPAQVADTVRFPSGDWPAFVLGAVLSLPALALYRPRLAADADSLRIIASIRYVQRGNLDFLVETQDSIGPHLVLGPILALFGVEGLRWFTIISLQVLAGLVAWLTRRVSGSMLAAALSAVALLSITPVMSRTIQVPMYPTMLVTGSLGCWLAYRVVVGGARWYYAAGAGLLLMLSQETHAVGQLFFGVPLLLLLLAPDVRRGLARLRQVYLALVVVLLPRLVANFSEGGFSQLRSNRTDYWISEGYLRQVQSEFLTYPGVNDSRGTYLLKYPSRFLDSLGPSGWLVLTLAVLALLGLHGRRRWLVLGFVGLIAASMTALTIQPSARYFSPLWPGLVAMAGIAAAKLVRSRLVVFRVAGAAAALALVTMLLTTLRTTGLRAQEAVDGPEENGYHRAAELIDDGRGVIGVRASALLSADPELETYGTQFLPEEDYVTFLTWPSDEEVIEMFEHYDIGWVVTAKNRRIDIDYNNAWLRPHYGLKARHTYMLRNSSKFCRVPVEAEIALWKLGPCEDGTEPTLPTPTQPTDQTDRTQPGWPTRPSEKLAPSRPADSRPAGDRGQG